MHFFFALIIKLVSKFLYFMYFIFKIKSNGLNNNYLDILFLFFIEITKPLVFHALSILNLFDLSIVILHEAFCIISSILCKSNS